MKLGVSKKYLVVSLFFLLSLSWVYAFQGSSTSYDVWTIINPLGSQGSSTSYDTRTSSPSVVGQYSSTNYDGRFGILSSQELECDYNVSSCGYNFANSGVYCINESLSVSGDCFNSFANGITITIHCLNNSITGDGTGSAFVFGNSGTVKATIVNCTIQNFQNGVSSQGNVLLDQISVSVYDSLINVSNIGIEPVEGADGPMTYIQNNTIYADTGIKGELESFSYTNVTIKDNYIHSNSLGITGPFYTLMNNTIITDDGYCLDTIKSQEEIINNTFSSPNNSVINYVLGSGPIVNNTFKDSKVGIGINSGGATGILFYYNYFYNITDYYVNTTTEWYYNNSVGHGNYYDDIDSWDIVDTNDDRYGDSGSDYPYNSSQTKWVGPGNDWGPIVLPPGGWQNITTPEGIFEPPNPSLTGTHVNTFQIKFWYLNLSNNQELKCYIKQSNGTIFTVGVSGIDVSNQNFTINYTVQNTDSIINDPTVGYIPWVLKNCTISDTSGLINNQTLNRRIYVHDDVYWDDSEVTRAVACETAPGKYFNNTEKCEFLEDAKFALQMRNGNPVNESCYNNAGKFCSDPYCNGIAFPTCDYPSFFSGYNLHTNDPNNVGYFTSNFGSYSTPVWYTVWTNTSSGTLKVRVRETLNSKTFSIAIKNLTYVDPVNSGVYGENIGGGTLDITDQGDGTWALTLSRLATPFTGTLDFTFNVSFTNQTLNGSRLIPIVIAYGVETNAGSPDVFEVQFDRTKGPRNNNESETTPIMTDGPVCGDNTNNDFDYLNAGAWDNSYDCFDPDCNNLTGGTQTNEFGSGKTGLCNYGTETNCTDEYDNDYDYIAGTDFTDCHDSDCFHVDPACPAVETICNDGINNDWDYTIGESGQSSDMKIENNGTKYDSSHTADLIDCEDIDCNGTDSCEWGYELTCDDNFDNDALQMKDCELATLSGATDMPTPEDAEYDCSVYCRANNLDHETGAYCNDNIDNDWDAITITGYYSDQYSVNISGGVDCRWVDYNPDEDCNWTILGNGKRCELAHEVSCDDSFDNDYDFNATTMPRAGWTKDAYENYYNSSFVEDGDYDDYDCAGKSNAATSESINASWCFDGIDNDLDAYIWNNTLGDWQLNPDSGIDCDDPDCIGVSNPNNPNQTCLAYEYNASDPYFTSLPDPGFYCHNGFDDDADGPMDCMDSDCNKQFSICTGPCYNQENVTWDSCSNGFDDDYDSPASTDCHDSDCLGMVGNSRGGLCQSTELMCDDNLDNDADGLIDCADSDCVGKIGGTYNNVSVLCEATETSCNDNFDNDRDGYIDCYDSDCNSVCSLTDISGTSPISLPVWNGQKNLNGVTNAYVKDYTRQVRNGEYFNISLKMTGSSSDAQWTIGAATGYGPFPQGDFDTSTAHLEGPNAADFSLSNPTFGSFIVQSNNALPSGYEVWFVIKAKNVHSMSDFELTYSEATGSVTSVNNQIFVEVDENVSPQVNIIKATPGDGNLTLGDSVYIRANVSDNNQLGLCDWSITGPENFDPADSTQCRGSFKPTTEGTYTIQVTPKDYYSNVGSPGSITYEVNLLPSSINITVNKSAPFFNYSAGELFTVNATFNLSSTDSLGTCHVIIKNQTGFEQELASGPASGNYCEINNINSSSIEEGVYRLFVRVDETTDNNIIDSLTTPIFFCNQTSTGVCAFADFNNDGKADWCDSDKQGPSVENVTAIPNSTNQTNFVNITANVTDPSGVQNVYANITFPNNSTIAYLMQNHTNELYWYLFGNTYQVGNYTATIWAYDSMNNLNNTEETYFEVQVAPGYGNSTLNITYPYDNSSFGYYQTFNLTANITANGNISYCNATLNILNTSIINITSTENYTHVIGNLTNESKLESWNLTVVGSGSTNISVELICMLGIGSNDTVYNISSYNVLSVNLVLPENNSAGKSSNVNFTCNASSLDGLKNMTIYIWNSTGLFYSDTKDISGTVNSSTWEVSGLLETNYTWNCKTYDNTNNYNWSIYNYTYNLDLTPPDVFLIEPLNDSMNAKGVINFTANVTDNVNNNNCTLYTNITGSWVVSGVNEVLGKQNTTTWNLTVTSSGYYIWNVKCCDSVDNCAWNSTNYTFTVVSNPPEVFNVNTSKKLLNTTNPVEIQAVVKDDSLGVDKVLANVSYPDGSYHVFDMKFGALDHIVIMQVNYDDNESENNEYVLLFNPTNHTINITSSWYITDGEDTDYLCPYNLTPGQYYLFVDSGTPLYADNADCLTSDATVGNGLGNSGDHVELWDGTNLIDCVGWGTESCPGETPFSNVGQDNPISRKPFNWSDTDNNDVDFDYSNKTILNTNSTRTPIYYLLFTDTLQIGKYNVTIIANNTAGLVNNTEETYFEVQVAPGYGNSTLNITYPYDNSSFGYYQTFNLTANITANGNISYCNATLNILNTSIINITSTENYTHVIGNLTNESKLESWNLTGIGIGSTDINVSLVCAFGLGSYDWVYNVSIESPNLNVNLTSPLNNTISNKVNQTFTCNITDNTNLKNATLYIWNSTGDLYYNITNTSLFGTSTLVSWNVTNMDYDNYTWNCKVYDVSNTNNWSVENYTLKIMNISDKWLNLTLPEGIYYIEPASPPTAGNYKYEFNITFVKLFASSGDVIGCYVNESNCYDSGLPGCTQVFVNKTLSNNYAGENVSVSYKLKNSDSVNTTLGGTTSNWIPWRIHNCSLIRSGSVIYNDTNITWRIHVHSINWTSGDIANAVNCKSLPNQYMQNTIRCDNVGDISFAVAKYGGAKVELYCHDNVDNPDDPDTAVDTNDGDCWGITYSNRKDLHQDFDNSSVYYSPSGSHGTLANEIPSGDINCTTTDIFNTEICWTLHSMPNGTFKIRFRNWGISKVLTIIADGFPTLGDINKYAPVNTLDSNGANNGLMLYFNDKNGNPILTNNLTSSEVYPHKFVIKSFNTDQEIENLDTVVNLSFSNPGEINLSEGYVIRLTLNYVEGSNYWEEHKNITIYFDNATYKSANEHENDIWVDKSGITWYACNDTKNGDFDYLNVGTAGAQNAFEQSSYDCYDPDCNGQMGPAAWNDYLGTYTEGVCNYALETICYDGYNNDWATEDSTWGHANTGLTLVDCRDPDCDNQIGNLTGGQNCTYNRELNCSDNFDNDMYQSYDCVADTGASGGSYDYWEYDCQGYCRDNGLVPTTETGTLCDNGIDDDMDLYLFTSNTATFGSPGENNTIGAGMDCRWIGNNPDEDCNWTILSSGKRCELGHEVTCDDNFDNDYDSGSGEPDPGWSSDYYNNYFGSSGLTFSDAADYDDYDCQNGPLVPANESLNASWCFDGADNDLDYYYWDGSSWKINSSNGIDCADPDCNMVSYGNKTCAAYEYNASDPVFMALYGSSLCSDGFDNDADGLIDCADPDCQGQFDFCGPCSSTEMMKWDACADGSDNDADGSTDCTDTDCNNKLANTNSYSFCGLTEFRCNDTQDNDGDGLVDCADPDCNGIGLCSSEICNDDIDNDNDGYIDCADSDCTCVTTILSGTYTPPTNSTANYGGVSITWTSRVRVGKPALFHLVYSSNYDDASLYLGRLTAGMNEAIDAGTGFNANLFSLTGPDASNFETQNYAEDTSHTKGSIQLYDQDHVGTNYAGFDITVNVPTSSTLNYDQFEYYHSISGSTTSGNYLDVRILDDIKPIINEIYLEPGNGKIKYDSSIWVGVNASDQDNGDYNDGAIYRCFYNITGPNGYVVTTTSSSTCRYSISNIIDDGNYVITTWAEDTTGNLGDINTTSINVDLIPSYISNSLSLDRVFYNSSSANVQVSADFKSDDVISQCEVYLRPSNETSFTNIVNISTTQTGDDISCNGNFALPSSDNMYEVYVLVRDAEGDVARSNSKIFYVCNSLGSSGVGTNGEEWDCRYADFDGDGVCDYCNQSLRVNLLWPNDKYVLSYYMINVSCDASSTTNELSNISLYTNITGTWLLNDTINVSGMYASVLFNISVQNQSFMWNCKATDNSSNEAYGLSNRTILVSLNWTSPIIYSIECSNDTINYYNCSLMGINETITNIRANVTDGEGDIINVSFRLMNTDTGIIYYLNNTTYVENDYTIVNPNVKLNVSGYYNITVIAYDGHTNSTTNNTRWLIPYGNISFQLVQPTGDINVTRYNVTNFSVRVTCNDGDCLNVPIYIDPGYTSNGSDYLRIWDEDDGYESPLNEQIKFYANYSSNTATCIINFTDSQNNNMVYNSSLGLFTYNRTFSSTGTFTYNVSCNDTGHNYLNTSDDVLIGNCKKLVDDLYINSDSRICYNKYNINDYSDEGILIINASNIFVNLSNSEINTNGTALVINYNISNISLGKIKNVKIYGKNNTLSDISIFNDDNWIIQNYNNTFKNLRLNNSLFYHIFYENVSINSSCLRVNDFVSLNTSCLRGLNKTANLTLFSNICPTKIWYKSNFPSTRTEIYTTGSEYTSATIYTCDYIGDGYEVLFSVNDFGNNYGFAAYRSENSSLTISDNSPKGLNENVSFTANYTNLSNQPITPSINGWCNLTIEGNNYSMSYNSVSKLYELNLSFSTEGTRNYRIVCNDTTGFYDQQIKEKNISIVSTKSGPISTTVGDTPFYTTDNNPQYVNLSNGESVILTWLVNATGSPNTTHTFYYTNGSTISDKFNVTIVDFPIDNPPNIVLNYPPNATILYNGSISFNYTVNDDFGLSNCSLYTNESSTFNISKTETSIINHDWNLINYTLPYGYYIWNIMCYDTGNNTAFAIENYTLKVDLPDADVDLLFPADGKHIDKLVYNFTCNVTDQFNLSYVTFYINTSGTFQPELRKNVTGLSANVTFTFSGLINGTYLWSCSSTNNQSKTTFADENRTITSNATITPAWENISYPEGVYEPYATGLPGTHKFTFNITFRGFNATVGDYVECNLSRSDGTTFILHKDVDNIYAFGNFSLNYTLQQTDPINKTKPWRVLNCSLWDDNTKTTLYYWNSSNYSHPLNKWILVHNNTWTKFDTIDDDAYRAGRCFLGIPKRYFNNTYYCDYVGDVAFAVSMASGFAVEGNCHDGIDNDGNGDIDCADRYCRGIPYTCIPHAWAGDPFGGTCSNGLCWETKTVGGHSITYYYNRYIRPSGTLKVRFDGGNYNTGNPISFAITDLPFAYSGYGKYHAPGSYSLPNDQTTATSYATEDPDGYNGDIDMVMYINLSGWAPGDYNISVYIVQYGSDLLIAGIPITITASAPSVWNESETGTGRTSPCLASSVDEDLDYYSNCADQDCDRFVGGTDCTGNDAICVYGTENNTNDRTTCTTCMDCFDNDADGNIDCGDMDCDLMPGDYTNTSILCHVQGEGRNVYDGGIYDWLKACTDNFDNDRDGQIDCWDHSYCWGRGGTSTILPCPAYENNTLSWCDDGVNNDYDSYTDCLDLDCWQIGGTSTTDPCPAYENNTASWCFDGIDNDYDDGTGNWDTNPSTGVDCADYDCRGVAYSGLQCPLNETISINGSFAPEQCFDGIDNDLDSPTMQYYGPGDFIDCADPDCTGVTNPSTGQTCLPYEYNITANISASYCSNSIDDDADEYLGWPNGGRDCKDPDCNKQFGMCGPCPTWENVTWDSCSDGIDNDVDMSGVQIDCRESECNGMIANPNYRTYCGSESTQLECEDGKDNDGNGLVDCADSGCNAYCPTATETNCNDDIDNDNDGYIDCADNNCFGVGSCASKSWSTVSCTTVPHWTSYDTVASTTVQFRHLHRHYVNTNYEFYVRGTNGHYGSLTVTFGDATTLSKYFPYDATTCTIVSGDTSKVKWVSSQSEVGQLQDNGAFDGGFEVLIRCNGKSSPQSKSFPIIVANELSGGQTENGEESYTSTVYENNPPSITKIEIEPGNGVVKYGGSYVIRGIPANDPSGICQCTFNVGGNIYTTNGDCMLKINNVKEDASSLSISVSARDGVYNQGTSMSTTYNLDVTPKSNSISLDKSEPFYLSTESLTYSAQFNSADNGYISSCTVNVEDYSGTNVYSSSSTVSGTNLATCSGNVPLSSLSDGVYFLRVRATDEDGASVNSLYSTFYICNSNSSSGPGFNCYYRDMDQDGYPDILKDICEFLPTISLNVRFNLSTKGNESIVKNMTILQQGSPLVVYSNTTTNQILYVNMSSGTYDVSLLTYNGDLYSKLLNATINENDYHFKFDKFTSSGSVYYVINTNMTYNQATLNLSYNGVSYTQESNVRAFVCSNWDYDNQVCTGSYSEITSTLDTTNKRIILQTPYYDVLGIKIMESTVQTPSEGGFVGGGGEVNISSEELTELLNKTSEELAKGITLSKDSIEGTVNVYENFYDSISLTNNYLHDFKVNVYVDGLDGLSIKMPRYFNLHSGQTYDFDFRVEDIDVIGVQTGNLYFLFTADNVNFTIKVPIRINVLSEFYNLESKLNILEVQGDTAYLDHEIITSGIVEGPVRVKYSFVDENNNIVAEYEQDVMVKEGTNLVTEKLNIPQKLLGKSFTIISSVEGRENFAYSYDEFKLKKPKVIPIEYIVTIASVSIIGIILILKFVIL